LIHKHICLIPVSIATILKPFAICSWCTFSSRIYSS
jgi:hypothetical protein